MFLPGIYKFYEPHNFIMKVPVAQWIARWTSNPKVPGSNPGRDAKTFEFLKKNNLYQGQDKTK